MSNKNFTSWAEEYFYRPNLFQKFLSYLLSPLSIIYCLVGKIRRVVAKKEDFGLPVISVGNLNVGGSGKTPFCIEISKEFEKVAIILRGYKRESKGLIVVKDWQNILCDVRTSGDEAMLYATSTNALVIVSVDRIEAIQKAKEMGVKVVILDDGFGKVNIKKFDILIYPNPAPANNFCLPSGAYRESVSNYKNADLALHEDVDFKRKTKISNETKGMILVTAIANPARLDKYLPKSIKERFYFPDHYMYKKDELEKLLEKTGATSILTTRKDFVKIKDFGLNISILELEFEISLHVKERIKNYINSYKNK
ncbi:MAG: tetraacyldisaccharide 4'-kinase [Campylobacteraceae bacterium]